MRPGSSSPAPRKTTQGTHKKADSEDDPETEGPARMTSTAHRHRGGDHKTDIAPNTDMDMGRKESDGSLTSDCHDSISASTVGTTANAR